MEFNGYEFTENYLPDNFEYNIRSLVNFNLAFYLKKKYIPNDCDWLFEDTHEDLEDAVVYCPTCNEVFDIDKKLIREPSGGCSHAMWGYSEPVCPNEGSCGATCYLKNAAYKNNDLKRNYRFGFIQQTNRGVVVRVFKCDFVFAGERYELRREGEFYTKEAMRIFFNADRTTEIYSRMVKSYGQYSGYFINVGERWLKKKKYQDIADFVLLDDLTGTLLAGFEKYVRLTEKFVTDDAMKMTLLLAMFNVPALKYVIKAGFMRMAEEIVVSFLDIKNSRLPINKKAKNLKDFLGFDVSKLDHISKELKEDLSVKDLLSLRTLNRLGIEFSEVNFIMSTNQHFIELLNMLGDEETKRALKYLRAQQDIAAENKLGDYYDYLSQVKLLSLNLENKQVRYPKNLNRAHARLSAMTEYHSSFELRDLFKRQAMRYEGFCYRQKNISLRALRTVEELKLWAIRFSNCSGGYVDRIAKGSSMIFVIVDRNAPQEPYFMLEYNPATKAIVQCRGYNNNTNMNDDIKVKEFCHKWLEFIKDKKPAKLSKPKSKAVA